MLFILRSNACFNGVMTTVVGTGRDLIHQHIFILLSPLFHPQVFTYEITNPDVAVLNLQVFDEDITSSDFIGFSALPVSCLRNGLRTVGLFNKNGFREREYGFATLFVRISVEPLDGSPMPTKQHSILSSRNSKSYFKTER